VNDAGLCRPVPSIRVKRISNGRLAEVMDGETVRLFSRHARDLANDKGDALDGLSDRYREVGWILRSAEAAADASRAHLRSGNESMSRRSSMRASLISEDFTHLTPPLRDIPDGLTARELDVAGLTASGLANQEMADRLYLSVQTIENHLSRIYRKLGISDRSDLAQLVPN
jgi:DNA-binding CsgD family transcriptional regulator